jgi:hypothetical protein
MARHLGDPPKVSIEGLSTDDHGLTVINTSDMPIIALINADDGSGLITEVGQTRELTRRWGR